MTERLPRLVFVTLALACSLAAPSTWAVTGKNSCRSPAGIVDADQKKYSDQQLSYHDALCAAVMLRIGSYRVFGFDRDFFVLGFELLPGVYQLR